MKPIADADVCSHWLSRLLEEQGGALALYAAQWTTAADDCVQEALVELARQRPLPANPVAWLYRVVKHRALNRARGERRRKQYEHDAWRGRFTARANHEDPEQQRELLDAIATLAERDREVVVLKIWGGLTFAEIADVAGGSSSSVHRRYQQALDHLRQLWGVSCPQEMTKAECQ